MTGAGAGCILSEKMLDMAGLSMDMENWMNRAHGLWKTESEQ